MIYREIAGKRMKPSDILLAIEISDSSLGFDLGRKAVLMARHDVREYWVVDARKRDTTMHRDAQGETYGSVTVVRGTDLLVPQAPELSSLGLRLADLA